MPRVSASSRPTKPEPPDVAEFDQADQTAVAVIEPTLTPRPEPHPAAADVVSRRAAELAAAEVLLLKEVNDELLTPDENEFLRHLFPAQFEREQELQRVSKYRRLQTAAGTVAERAAAEENAAAATEKLAIQGEGIRSQISKLETVLLDLQTAASDANGERDRREAALAKLADATLLPEPLRSRHRFGRDRWERDFGIPARTKRLEANGCEAKATWTADGNADEIASYCQSHKNPAVRELVAEKFAHVNRAWGNNNSDARDQRHVIVSAPLWVAHVADLRSRAEQLRAEADRLEQAGQPLKSELDSMLASLIPA